MIALCRDSYYSAVLCASSGVLSVGVGAVGGCCIDWCVGCINTDVWMHLWENQEIIYVIFPQVDITFS